jgi:phosphotransferase system IIB component
MKKLKFITLSIITIGIYYIMMNKKAKKLALSNNNVLLKESKLPFSFQDFIEYIGGIDNIVDVSSSQNQLSLVIKNKKIVLVEKIQSLGIKGIMNNSKGYSFVTGIIAKTLEEKIIELKNNV